MFTYLAFPSSIAFLFRLFESFFLSILFLPFIFVFDLVCVFLFSFSGHNLMKVIISNAKVYMSSTDPQKFMYLLGIVLCDLLCSSSTVMIAFA